jgi:hypothetical protein
MRDDVLAALAWIKNPRSKDVQFEIVRALEYVPMTIGSLSCSFQSCSRKGST